MRNLLALFLLLGCFNQRTHAQSEKTSIAIFPFVASLPENRGRASQIQQIVSEILRQKSNIELIDRSNDSLLVKELDFQIREQSVAAKGLVQQGKILGAQQIIVGTVSNVTVDEKNTSNFNIITKKTKSATQYTASVSFALQLSDVETGKVINQRAFNNRDITAGKVLNLLNVESGTSREEAILNAIKSTRGLILAWINESHPAEIKILKIEERDKKGYPETILVTGIDASLQKGSQVTVNEIEMIDAGDGKSLKRTKKIVELKVKEIQGDITVCRVMDGEKVLEEKMKAGAKMEFIVK